MTFRSLDPMLALLGLALVGCATSGARTAHTAADGGVLRGSVSYRERMLLPSDAVMEVTLVDVSRQDIPILLAETTVFPEDRQVPLPFELRYDRRKIDPEGSYALRATIHSGAQKLFTTDADYPVITHGNPTQVDLWLVRPGSRAVTSGLWGTAWRLEDLGGTAVIEDAEPTLEFPEAGRAAGSGSCNRFSGPVTISGESISFGALAATQMACAGPVGTQEAMYFKALQQAERLAFDGPALLIYSKEMDQPLRFVREVVVSP